MPVDLHLDTWCSLPLIIWFSFDSTKYLRFQHFLNCKMVNNVNARSKSIWVIYALKNMCSEGIFYFCPGADETSEKLLSCLCFWITCPCTAWESFRDLIPENERSCFVDAYNKRLNSDDKETQVRVILFALMTYLSGLINSTFFFFHLKKLKEQSSCLAYLVELVFLKWSCGLLIVCFWTRKSFRKTLLAWLIVSLLWMLFCEQLYTFHIYLITS